MGTAAYAAVGCAIALMLYATIAVAAAAFFKTEKINAPEVEADPELVGKLLALLDFDSGGKFFDADVRSLLEREFGAFSRMQRLSKTLLLYAGGEPARDAPLFVFHFDTAPFDGAASARDGKIFGRGAIDDKGALAAFLRAADEGNYFLFIATDEERGGGQFSEAVAILRARGVEPRVFDEGGFIADLAAPAAMVGQGLNELKIYCGAEAVLRPLRGRYKIGSKKAEAIAKTLLPYADLSVKAAWAALRPYRAVAVSLAPCAAFAEAEFFGDNDCCRFLCRDAEVLERVEKKAVRLLKRRGISFKIERVYSSDGDYELLKRALKASYGNLPIVPYATPGEVMSDKTGDATRFVPLALDARAIDAIHAEGEFITEDSLFRAVYFYRFLLKNQ